MEENTNNKVLRKTRLSELSTKYAEKPWSETFQLVHRSMEKARDKSKPCELILRCLQKLQEAQNVTSLSAMVSRLELIAKQRGFELFYYYQFEKTLLRRLISLHDLRLGSHLSPTETACYLTADLFYVEVLLLPSGQIEDVKVAQHGEAPQSNASLLQLLRMNKFEEFSVKLDDLASLYSILGDNETKIKVYTALQHMQRDLLKISNLPRHLKESDVRIDMILNGRIGRITPCKEGSPMSTQYYISPSHALMGMLSPGDAMRSQTAIVVVSANETTHRLQMESLISTPPQVDSMGLPVISPLSEANSDSLPAFFLLKLQPPVPTLNYCIHKMSQITGLPPDADLQAVPLIQLLQWDYVEDKHRKRSCDGKNSHFLMSLLDTEVHSYLFDIAAWECDSWKGALIHSVPFTHPAHVPPLLNLLRHQSAINTLLASCVTRINYQSGLVCDLICEILPESDCSFSVTFSFPDSDSLSVLFVFVADCCQMHCRLRTAGLVDHSLDDYISRVLARCMSIPITLRAIRKRIPSMAPPPLSLSEPEAALKAEHSPYTLPPCAAESTVTSLSSGLLSPQPMEEDDLPSNSRHYVMSVAAASVNGANTDAIANRSPCVSVGVYSHWVASSLPAEII